MHELHTTRRSGAPGKGGNRTIREIYFALLTSSHFTRRSAALATRRNVVAASTTYSFSAQRKGQPTVNSAKSGFESGGEFACGEPTDSGHPRAD